MNNQSVSAASQRKRHLLTSLAIVGAMLVLIAVLAKGLMLNPSKVPSALIDKPAMDFQVAWLQGQEYAGGDASTLNLSAFKGRPVVLNFWASWCVSCREEAIFFEQFWRRYRDQGVVVVGIAIQDTESAAKEFARYYGKSYILGLDTNGRASIDYGVYGVPETFLIDRQGKIRYKEAGPMTLEMLESKLSLIL